MGISARNRLPGTVVNVKVDGIMAQVDIAVGDNMVTSVITRDSAEELGLSVGDAVVAVVKATEVMIDKSDTARDYSGE